MASSLPKPTKNEIMQCQFSSWYPTFRNMNKNIDESEERKRYRHGNATMKSIIIPLPSTFIEYLLSDGVQLPSDATKVSSFVPPDNDDDNANWSSDDEEEIPQNKNDSDSDDEQPQQYSFPQLTEQINTSISNLKGSVLPKLNWSCPKDATWINNGSLKCCTAGDVYVLLKSSDFIMHDLEHVFDNSQTDAGGGEEGNEDNVQYELVLRKWCNFHPSMEFRCFVANHELVAISQRNHTQHFPHLSNDYLSVRSTIIDFFDETINGVFANGTVENYVFDVYVDKNHRVWIIDFNVWGSQTDSLLFNWKELMELSSPDEEEKKDFIQDKEKYQSSEARNSNRNDENKEEIVTFENTRPEMRIVKTELEIHHDPLASYRAPIDTVKLASIASSSGANPSFEEFMAMCQRPSEM